MAYFPYVTFVSVVSFNEVTIPAFCFCSIFSLHIIKRTLYTLARRYEFYVLVARATSHSNIKFISSRHRVISSIYFTVKVEWYPLYGPKSLFKFGEKRPIVCCQEPWCCCTHEQKMNFEGFTQNGCYGNQSQPLEVSFDSTDGNNPGPFTKQDLILKQAYLVGFCFVLFNKLKF